MTTRAIAVSHYGQGSEWQRIHEYKITKVYSLEEKEVYTVYIFDAISVKQGFLHSYIHLGRCIF